MEELLQIQFEELSSVKLNSSGIRIIKNKTILAPGFWNGRHYSHEEIVKCFNNTDWKDPDVMSLIADHKDDDTKGRPLTLRDWLGFTSNHYLTKEGTIKADLNICNQALSLQLIEGRAPFGISPFLFGKYDSTTNSQRDFTIKNNAIVVEPACKESYINAYLNDDGENLELSKLSNDDRINAKLEETTTTDVQGNKVDSHGLQPVKVKKKKKSDLIELKGGQNNMEKDKKKLEENQDSEEEKVDEVSEPVVEEVVEVAPVEEPEVVEEVVEEESEEKLMADLLKITEKLMNKKKLTPEQAKMRKLESEISSLRNEIKKLSEVKTDVKTEVSAEKLSAKARTIASTELKEEGFRMYGKGASQGSTELAKLMGY